MTEIPTFPGKPSRVPAVLLFGAVALVSGALGTVLLYFFFPEFREARIPPGSQAVIIQQPGKVVIEEGVRLDDLSQSLASIVVEFYPKASLLSLGGVDRVNPNSRLGVGVLVTSDGWILSTQAVKAVKGDTVVFNGSLYSILELANDESSPFSLYKISGANFPVVTFSNVADLRAGKTLAAVVSAREVARSQVINPFVATATDGVFSSDALLEAIQITSVPELPLGAPLFGLGGELVGFIFDEDASHIAPAYAGKSFLDDYLNGEDVVRPVLGARYVLWEERSQDRVGALLFQTTGAPAVALKSPAQLAGLKAGDFIISVSGQKFSDQIPSLFEAIGRLGNADTIRVGLVREGQEMNIDVDLKK